MQPINTANDTEFMAMVSIMASTNPANEDEYEMVDDVDFGSAPFTKVRLTEIESAAASLAICEAVEEENLDPAIIKEREHKKQEDKANTLMDSVKWRSTLAGLALDKNAKTEFSTVGAENRRMASKKTTRCPIFNTPCNYEAPVFMGWSKRHNEPDKYGKLHRIMDEKGKR